MSVGGNYRASVRVTQTEITGTVAEIEGGEPTIEVSTDGSGNIVLTYVGTLLGADNVEGPYEPVAGASSPLTVTPDQASRFYRASD